LDLFHQPKSAVILMPLASLCLLKFYGTSLQSL